jgi:hypothetical protein
MGGFLTGAVVFTVASSCLGVNALLFPCLMLLALPLISSADK